MQVSRIVKFLPVNRVGSNVKLTALAITVFLISWIAAIITSPLNTHALARSMESASGMLIPH